MSNVNQTAPKANASKSNDASPISTIIRSAMTSQEQDGTRQRDLVLILMQQEVAYGATMIPAFFTVKGADRADKYADTLSDLSAEYATNLATVARLKEQAKGKETSKLDKEKLTLQAESINAKLRAANLLFQRALLAVYFLRTAKATGVDVSKVTKGSITFLRDDPDHKGTGKPERVRTVESINALTRFGKAAMDAKVGKAAPRARAAGDGGADVGKRGVQMAANVVESFLTMNNKPLDDYDDADEAALSKVLMRLFVAKFGGENGAVDPKDVTDWIRAEKLDQPTTKPKATTPKADEKPTVAVPPRRQANGNGKPTTATPKAA